MSIPTPQSSHAGFEATSEAAGFSSTRLQRLSASLRADCDAGVIPGCVALIIRDGTPAFFEAFGWADRRSGRPMARDSVFRIASMTKPITTVAGLMLMERGDLVLSDPLARHLPELKDLKVGIEQAGPENGERRLTLEACRRPPTVHDLMRHTAGFTYGQFGNSLVQRAYRAANTMDQQQTNAQMLGKLAQLPLAYQPGTTFEYGMGTDVLGRLVEVVSGANLDRFFAEHIFEPLGMLDTGFGVGPHALHRLAEPERAAAGGVPSPLPNDPARPAKWHSGGGGLLSTAADYARFAQMLLNHGELDGVRLLARKTTQLMLQNHLPATFDYGALTAELGIAAPLAQLGQGYGLGIGVRTQAGLSPVPGSMGDFYWGGALGPYFWADPAERIAVVFMLQELNVQVRTRYRALLRALVYQALI
jgi:CubicO group peptidase (beta-lactamase class C family)